VTRLLALATWLCGESSGRQVFEPLLADWDRELRHAHSSSARAAVIARGSLAFMLTVASCGLRHALTEDTGMWKYSLLALATAMGLGIASEMAIVNARATGADFPADVLLELALRSAVVTAFATALLPALFLLRRDARVTGRTATLWLAAGALFTAAAIVVLPSPDGYQLTAEQNERMYQRSLANDRAGRYQYPGSVYRHLREPSTPETRRASYEKFLTWAETQRVDHPEPTPWQRLLRSSLPMLAVLFGIIGWNLAGVLRPTVMRAFVWWGVAWFAMLAMDGRIASIFRVANFRRPAWWVLPLMTGLAALAVTIASTRRHRGTNPLGTPGTLRTQGTGWFLNFPFRFINVRRLAEEHLGRLHHRLRQRRMRVDGELHV
jgi:hypothetical protein